MRTAVILCAAAVAAGATLPARADYAVAFGDNGLGKWALGWSIDQPTKTQADTEALAKCNSDAKSPDACKFIFGGRGMCFSFAISQRAPISWAYASRKTSAEADEKAKSICDGNKNDCSVILSKCESPRPMKFIPPLPAAEVSAFTKKIRECGDRELSKYPTSAMVDIDIYLNKDGTISKDPSIVGTIQNEDQRQLADALVRVLNSCQPFTMFSGDYDSWKTVSITMRGFGSGR